MLTTEQQNLIAKHLNTRAQRPKCPVCGTTTLRVQPQVVELPTAESDSTIRRVVITCTYCGHDMYFSPEVMGLTIS
ncbi:hypothetical protein [Longibacter salinarum]|nr:hypothetical protein [Longibacter salinarum]